MAQKRPPATPMSRPRSAPTTSSRRSTGTRLTQHVRDGRRAVGRAQREGRVDAVRLAAAAAPVEPRSKRRNVSTQVARRGLDRAGERRVAGGRDQETWPSATATSTVAISTPTRRRHPHALSWWIDRVVLSPDHLIAMMSVERTTFRPLQRYEQIAERLADDIRSGVLGARRAAAVRARPRAHARGEPRLGARGARVAALQGVVETRHGAGTFVVGLPAVRAAARRLAVGGARGAARARARGRAARRRPRPAPTRSPRSCSPRWRPSRWTSPPGTPPTASSIASSPP